MRACVVVENSRMKISRRRLAEYGTKLHQRDGIVAAITVVIY